MGSSFKMFKDYTVQCEKASTNIEKLNTKTHQCLRGIPGVYRVVKYLKGIW